MVTTILAFVVRGIRAAISALVVGGVWILGSQPLSHLQALGEMASPVPLSSLFVSLNLSSRWTPAII
jgi:hypothetical protein